MIFVLFSIAIVAVFLFWASYSISSVVYVKSLCRNRRAGRVLALTFDDGVDEVLTPQVLDVLHKYDIKAAFFIIGEKAERSPEIVGRIVAEGHTLGNHTYSHEGYFPLKSCSAMIADLKKSEEALSKASGRKIKYFRPPFGVTNPMIGCAVRKMEYATIGWSIRSLDTLNRSRDWVLSRIVDRLHDGGVILLHDNRCDSPLLLENVIKASLKKGYRFVSIEELFNKIELS